MIARGFLFFAFGMGIQKLRLRILMKRASHTACATCKVPFIPALVHGLHCSIDARLQARFPGKKSSCLQRDDLWDDFLRIPKIRLIFVYPQSRKLGSLLPSSLSLLP